MSCTRNIMREQGGLPIAAEAEIKSYFHSRDGEM